MRRDVARGRDIEASRLAAFVLSEAARERRRIRIEGAHCTGTLDLRQANLGIPLELVNCVFEGEILLDGAVLESVDLTGSTAAGLRADRMRVHGDLLLNAMRIGDAGSPAAPIGDPGFDGDRSVVSRRVPDESVVAALRLTAARIDGGLSLEGTTLGGPGPWAMFAPLIAIGGSLSASRLETSGGLYLRDARVGQSVLLDHAAVGAVDATGLSCALGFYADWGFTCRGPVRLRGAVVGSVVTFHDAMLSGPAGAAVLTRLRTPRLRVDFRAPPMGALVLRDSRIGSYVDSPSSWPAPGGLDVEGLVYERLGSTEHVGVKQRLAWLAKDTAVGAGSFEQLATSYQRAGHERAARMVRHARERRLRHEERLPGRIWSWLQDVLFGYGYIPGRALLWLVLLVGFGLAWFTAHPPAPVPGGVRRPWDPVLYSLDLIVPIANLGQRTAWEPTGIDKAIAVLLMLAGWLLATAVIAGAHRALSRN
ncbi:hypothetical protein [Streptomyces sp. NPDC020489]|uniref:hypothetical protein n=1 Tax=Streptomyces sp. NPDC020489 TaxID=3365077 RepID=UPI0037A13AF2